MDSIRPPLMRRAVPLVGGLAFVIILLVAAWRIVDWRGVAMERDRARLQTFVEDQVAAWEDGVLAELADELDAAAHNPAQARALQRRLRHTRRWFNSLYVWQVETDGENEMLFPAPPTVEPRAFILSRYCIRRAIATRVEPVSDHAVARAFVRGCRVDANPVVRLFAASEAAYLLRDRPSEALVALDLAPIPPEAALSDLARKGLPPGRVAALRYARGTMLAQLGRVDESLDLLNRLGLDITQLDAPDLAAPLSLFVNGEAGILATLRRNGRREQALQLNRQMNRAGRRLIAYREVQEQIVDRAPERGAGARFIRDQYSDEDPYLLYFGWAHQRGVAIQIEQKDLVAWFLNQRMKKYRHHATILGERDQWVAGARRGGEFVVTVPFSQTLSHLRVGIRQSALEAATANTNEQSIVLLVIVTLCALLGIVALGAQMRLSSQQYELISRQRAFTTRVTHELKTPLAGIRVMAENLESGAFRTGEHRAEMARRIVEEADRLTSRVDEVLSVAQQRTIPSPALYDPEEAALGAVDLWGPRLEDAGVELHADLHPTDEVLGDCDALRDAIGCLLDNALKYRRTGTRSEVWLDLRQEGRQVVIAVRDNGIGVPKAMRKSIFQRFVRVEGPHRGKSGGHGLGLNQVREIVEAHSGTVQCVDGVDGGAAFVIRVPAQRTA